MNKKMLRRKESLENCDRAKTWLLCCRRNRIMPRDVAQLIAREVFSGFEYISGEFEATSRLGRSFLFVHFRIEISNGSVRWVSDTSFQRIEFPQYGPNFIRSISSIYHHIILPDDSIIRVNNSRGNGRVVTPDELCAIVEAVKSTPIQFGVIMDGVKMKTLGQVFDQLNRSKPPRQSWIVGNLMLASNEPPPK